MIVAASLLSSVSSDTGSTERHSSWLNVSLYCLFLQGCSRTKLECALGVNAKRLVLQHSETKYVCVCAAIAAGLQPHKPGLRPPVWLIFWALHPCDFLDQLCVIRYTQLV